MTPNFKITYEGNLRTTALHLKSGTTIETDAPVDNQGKGERFSPTDLAAVSLAACIITTMGIKAGQKNIDLKNTTLSVQKIMADQPRRIAEIKIHIDFDKNLKVEEQDKRLLELVADKCPVKASLHPDVKVEVTYNWS